MSNRPRPVKLATAAVEVKSIAFLTDGTAKGTTLTVNGEAVKDLLSASLYMDRDSYGCYLSCSYTVGDAYGAVPAGQLRERHVYSLVYDEAKEANNDSTMSGMASVTAHDKLVDKYAADFPLPPRRKP